MRRLLIGTAFTVGFAALGCAPGWAKTVKECNAEYSANKAAIQPVQKKADFVTACRAGTEVIPGAASAAPPPAAAPAPAAAAPAPAAPAPTAAPAKTGFFGRKKAAPTAAAPAPQTAAVAPSGANQFASEAQAKGRCPSGLVVWVNTTSGIYHFAGTKNYGNTKAGGYMCETDATAAGDRAAKTEKHP